MNTIEIYENFFNNKIQKAMILTLFIFFIIPAIALSYCWFSSQCWWTDNYDDLCSVGDYVTDDMCDCFDSYSNNLTSGNSSFNTTNGFQWNEDKYWSERTG